MDKVSQAPCTGWAPVQGLARALCRIGTVLTRIPGPGDRRRSKAALERSSHHLLRDIGLDRADVAYLALEDRDRFRRRGWL